MCSAKVGATYYIGQIIRVFLSHDNGGDVSGRLYYIIAGHRHSSYTFVHCKTKAHNIIYMYNIILYYIVVGRMYPRGPPPLCR